MDELYSADSWNLSDLGVVVVGDFNDQGMPTGWTLDTEKVSAELPRWILREPVLEITASGFEVYIRGMFSKRLTSLRATRVLSVMRAAETQLGEQEKP